MDSGGRIKIESKDDMRRRGLPSPDRADALVMAFVGHEAHVLTIEEQLNLERLEHRLRAKIEADQWLYEDEMGRPRSNRDWMTERF